MFAAIADAAAAVFARAGFSIIIPVTKRCRGQSQGRQMPRSVGFGTAEGHSGQYLRWANANAAGAPLRGVLDFGP